MSTYSIFYGETPAIRNRRIRNERMAAARKLGTHTKAEFEAMKLEFGNRCVRCWETFSHLDRDHIIPIYQGGSDSIENIQPLCAWCNTGKGSENFDWKAFRRSQK